jgi:glycosylphosphatidylinositol transamidase (GPIT) subunit GPI8
MGGSYLDNTFNCKDTSPNLFGHNCSCEVPGADDDLCVHYFDELDFSSFDISGDEEIDDGLELDEIVSDLSQEPIFRDVDENENIFDRNGSDDSESLSNNLNSTEGLASDGVSPSVEGEKLTDAKVNKEDVTKSSTSNNVSSALRLQY